MTKRYYVRIGEDEIRIMESIPYHKPRIVAPSSTRDLLEREGFIEKDPTTQDVFRVTEKGTEAINFFRKKR